jgi:hypothetical protein
MHRSPSYAVLLVLAVVAALALGTGALARPGTKAAPTPPSTQHVAVPSYFYPDTRPDDDDPYWAQLAAGVGRGVGLAIINPDSGPGDSVNQDYVAQIALSQDAGLSVLGYVFTDYGRRSSAEVNDDVDDYYRWYGVDGIFFDEASTDDAPPMVAYY